MEEVAWRAKVEGFKPLSILQKCSIGFATLEQIALVVLG